MYRKACLVFAMLLIFISVSFAGSGTIMKEGLWEITSKMEMQGMPMQMPPITFTQCLTNQELVPNQSQAGQECRMKNVKTKGNTVTWDTVCDSHQGKVISSGKITYKGDRFDGVVTTNMETPDQGLTQMKMLMSGRRIGKCSK